MILTEYEHVLLDCAKMLCVLYDLYESYELYEKVIYCTNCSNILLTCYIILCEKVAASVLLMPI